MALIVTGVGHAHHSFDSPLGRAGGHQTTQPKTQTLLSSDRPDRPESILNPVKINYYHIKY